MIWRYAVVTFVSSKVIDWMVEGFNFCKGSIHYLKSFRGCAKRVIKIWTEGHRPEGIGMYTGQENSSDVY